MNVLGKKQLLLNSRAEEHLHIDPHYFEIIVQHKNLIEEWCNENRNAVPLGKEDLVQKLQKEWLVKLSPKGLKDVWNKVSGKYEIESSKDGALLSLEKWLNGLNIIRLQQLCVEHRLSTMQDVLDWMEKVIHDSQNPDSSLQEVLYQHLQDLCNIHRSCNNKS